MTLSKLNALPLYLYVGGVLLLISIVCLVFMVKSYRAGLSIGMDKKVLKRTMTSSLTFTLLPSISILLGVIALSGSLGVPLSWLRLSVIGALQYELNVAEIAATNVGMTGLKLAEMDLSRFATISLVMTTGILGGPILSLFFLGRYLKKVQGKPKNALDEPGDKKSFGSVAIVAMFIGLCSAYIASYIGTVISTPEHNVLPLFTALVAAAAMAVFEFFTIKKNKGWLDNFSVATSMLIAMAAAVLLNIAIGGVSS